MKRALKIGLWVIVTIIVLLAGAIFAVTRFIDPNDFKPDIARLAREDANLDLDIQGQLAWTFWPSLGVTVGHTESHIAGEKPLFAAFDKARVSVAVWPLLFGQVHMDGVELDGLSLNLEQTANGANWDKIGPPGKKKETTAGESSQATGKKGGGGGIAIPVSIPSLAVDNGRVRYRDTTSGTDMLVEHLNVNAHDVSLDKPFPLRVSLRYQDQSNIRVDASASTTLALDLKHNRYRLDPLKVDASIGGLTANPVDVHLQQSVDAALDDDRVSVRNLIIRAAGVKTDGNVEVTGISTKPKLSGELHVEPFDANAALKAVGISPVPTSDKGALKKVAVDATLSGPANSVIADPLKITVDDSTISGKAGITNLDTSHLMFDLALDHMKVDGYLPPATPAAKPAKPVKTGKSSSPPPLSTQPLLPLDTLRSLSMDGTFHAGSIQYQGIPVTDLQMKVDASGGKLELKQLSGKTLEGDFKANALLDASEDKPFWKASQTLHHLQIEPVAKMTLDKDLLKGVLDFQADVTAHGNSEKALMDSAAGHMTLDLTDGTVKGVNLHNTLVQGLNDMLGAYQALTAFIPGTKSGKLPSELSKDTHIVDMKVKSHLEDKVAYVDSLDADLQKGHVTGDGWLNIYNQDFDFHVGMKSPDISNSKYLRDKTWPIRCAGNLNGSASDWCRPDARGFREMGKKIAADAARDKIKQKLGVDVKGKTPEEVMKNAAKKKAEERAKKELQDKLKELFH